MGLKRAYALVVFLTVWALLVILGLRHSKVAWSQGEDGFDLGWLWLQAVVTVTVILTIRWRPESDGRPLWKTVPSFKEVMGEFTLWWPWIVVPTVLCGILEWSSVSALHSFALDETRRSLEVFAAYSCAFLTSILFWVAAFPCEQKLGLTFRRQRLWRAFLFCTVIVIVCLAIIQIFGLFQGFNSRPGWSVLRDLEFLLQRYAIVAFVFLTLRVFLPFIPYVIKGTPSTDGTFEGLR
jgi:hypothetical protein